MLHRLRDFFQAYPGGLIFFFEYSLIYFCIRISNKVSFIEKILHYSWEKLVLDFNQFLVLLKLPECLFGCSWEKEIVPDYF